MLPCFYSLINCITSTSRVFRRLHWLQSLLTSFTLFKSFAIERSHVCVSLGGICAETDRLTSLTTCILAVCRTIHSRSRRETHGSAFYGVYQLYSHKCVYVYNRRCTHTYLYRSRNVTVKQSYILYFLYKQIYFYGHLRLYPFIESTKAGFRAEFRDIGEESKMSKDVSQDISTVVFFWNL